MTVSSSASSAKFPGNGTTTVFPLPFRFFDNGDVTAYLIEDSSSTITPLSIGVNYTLIGAGEPEVDGNPVSQLTMLVAPPNGQTLVVNREMEAVQETDIINQARFYPEIHENVFDRLTMLIQQAIDRVSTSLSLDISRRYFDARGLQIKNLADPTDAQDATTKNYVDVQNNAQDVRIDALSAGLPGTNYAFPWSTTTTQSTQVLTPGFTFASATLAINGAVQTYGKAYTVLGNQIILAEAIPAGSEVSAILGQNVVPTDFFAPNSFSHSETYSDGSLSKHGQITVSVTDQPFNAVIGVDATAAFQAAYDFVPAGGEIIIPGPGPYTVGALTGTKEVIWTATYDINTNLSLLNLPGKIRGGFGSAELLRKNITNGGEFATFRLDRIAGYSGGSSGQVCSNIRATTTVSSNAANSFEWVGTFVLNNKGRGQNVAVYGQGNRQDISSVTVGGTFAGVFEATDTTQEVNPTSGLIGLEVDVFANGTDSVGRRVAIDVVIGKGVSAGAQNEVAHGIRFVPVLSDPTRARFRNVMTVLGDKDYVINVSGTGVENDINLQSTGGKIGVRVGGSHSDAGFVHDGTSPYGFRFSGTYSSGAAIRMPAGTGIAFESTGAIQIKYNSGSLQIFNGATLRTSFSTTTGAISIGSNQVIGPRNTGWAPMTGTANKATSYDTSTITLQQLAERFKALQDAITTHGAIGV